MEQGYYESRIYAMVWLQYNGKNAIVKWEGTGVITTTSQLPLRPPRKDNPATAQSGVQLLHLPQLPTEVILLFKWDCFLLIHKF